MKEMNLTIAYFSAEFGLDSSLPIYSGGLGILAGDHVKAASDLNLNLIGVGILYRKGYFRQSITPEGIQQATYPQLDPVSLGLKPVLQEGGKDYLLLEVPLAQRTLHLRIWRAQAGKIPVYLMDADLAENQEADRHLTDSLYGGDQATRLSQEIILGIGGVRLLGALQLSPDVWHINEGHAALMSLERIRQYSAKGLSFATALELVKSSTVFTTHTPVPAGHDAFNLQLLDQFLGNYYWQLGSEREHIIQLGKVGEYFNMTRLAVRTSALVNGVSQVHAAVTKEMFHRWTTDIPAQDIQVAAITNGVHLPTWLAPEMKELFSRFLSERWQEEVSRPETWKEVRSIPDRELWSCHQQIKSRALQQLGLEQGRQGLVVGFARRFAAYKRALLLLRDLERLERIVNDPQHPVSIVFAGKAHPADGFGQELIKRVVEVAQQERFKHKIFFLPDYDMAMAKGLVQGVDVWLNTPRKPLEASGTSGQKAALNGVLNCSVLDGWWNEGFNGHNGWAISSGPGTWEEQDQTDSLELYSLLEEKIVPLYYNRTEQGIPKGWVSMMKESIQSLAPVYNTRRMVTDYLERCYLPTAQRFARFAANGGEVAARVAAYKGFIKRHWEQVQVQSISLEQADCSRGAVIHSLIKLGSIWHKDVLVQAVGSNGQGGTWTLELAYVREVEAGTHLYQGLFSGGMTAWQQAGANVRVVPVSEEFVHGFELELSCWGRAGWR